MTRNARFHPARSVAVAIAGGAVAALATGCDAGTHAHARPATATPLPPGKAVQLAAAHARQLRSVTATFTRQGTGVIRQTVAGTITEQFHPALLADLAVPVFSVYGRAVAGGERTILSGSTVYYRQPTLTGVLGTRPWLDVPRPDLGKPIGGIIVGDSIALAEDNDPVIQAELLAAAQNVRQAGTSRLDGTTVTQYTGSYRLPAAVNALPTAARAVVEREQVTDGYLPIVTFSAWLDRSQQLRKLVVREQFQGANAIGQKAVIETQTSTIEVTSLNQAVTITIPPAAQISAVPRSAIGSP